MKNLLEIYSINIFHIDNTKAKTHIHEQEYQLFYLAQGSAHYSCDGKNYELSAGQALLIKPGEEHGRSRCRDCKLLDIKFSIYDHEFCKMLNGKSGLIKETSDTETALLLLILDAVESRRGNSTRTVALALELLLRETLNDRLRNDDEVLGDRSVWRVLYDLNVDCSNLTPCVQRALQFVTGFVALPVEPFSVAALADQVGYDKQYLSRTFRNDIGIPVTQYYGLLRVNKAKELLENTQLRVSELARILGYTHPAHFMKNFKKYTGLSPTKYRSQMRKEK